MDIREGTLVLVAIDRIPKTSIEKFAPGIVRQGTNRAGYCSVRFGSAFPEAPNVGIGMHKDSLVPLLMLSEEEWGMEPLDVFQRHSGEAVRNLAEQYVRSNSSLREFIASTQGES